MAILKMTMMSLGYSPWFGGGLYVRVASVTTVDGFSLYAQLKAVLAMHLILLFASEYL